MASTQKIRAFIAIEINDDIRDALSQLTERLAKGFRFAGAEPKWTRPEGIHLTLKFLGDIDKEQIPKIEKAMRAAAQNVAPIDYTVRGLGIFPSEWKPRVLWTGVKRGAPSIELLQRDLEFRLSRMGFAPEGRPFTPHLTLARFKSNKGVKGLIDVMHSHGRVYCGAGIADKMTLFQSELLPGGAVYTVLKEAPLEGQSADTAPPPPDSHEQERHHP